MLTTHWPLRHLRLTTERLVLRLPTEDELADLADLAAAGIHEPGERPFLTPWTDLEPAKRAQWVMQGHWSSLGSWSPDDWGLDLAVFRDGAPIGMVTLAAKQFAVLREVRSSSWFGLAHHGQGYGTEARTALLHLAFAELGAEAATSEVFQDNHGSQAVSRKLGYQPDGISRDVLHGEAVVSDRLRLTRADWRSRAVRHAVQVEGLEQCRSFFGAE
ncbi:GNAT family N-acetyltransferase [Kribbella sp. CA-294648]|uniref:GNAT family N-acetyltransferase n=1 Tax=Kribbella sp. CA-294648 TaxID=3239948 RepID=UPI003D8E101B